MVDDLHVDLSDADADSPDTDRPDTDRPDADPADSESCYDGFSSIPDGVYCLA